MNALSSISRAVADISTKEEFVTGMDFLINKLEIIPCGNLTKEQLEALYFSSTSDDYDKNMSNYDLDCKFDLNKETTRKVWQGVLNVINEKSLTFNDLIRIRDKDFKIALGYISLDTLIHSFVRAPKPILEKYFSNTSEMMKNLVLEELKNFKKLDDNTVYKAREEIVDVFLYLHKLHKIDLEKSGFYGEVNVNLKYKTVMPPKGEEKRVWYTFTKNGLPSELREKLISNSKEYLKDKKNLQRFKETFVNLLGYKLAADEMGILSLDAIASGADEFTQKILYFICDGVDMPVIDEIICNEIIQEEDPFEQFIMYMKMRGLMYIQSQLPFGTIANCMASFAPSGDVKLQDELRNAAIKLQESIKAD